MAPVQGKITINGTPMTAGNVVFQRADGTGDGAEGLLSAGQIDSSGNYTINTGGKSGAPLGKYKVAVTPSMVPTEGGAAAPAYDTKYKTHGSSPLEVDVIESPEPGRYDFDLQ
jgi:hypothetical protein